MHKLLLKIINERQLVSVMNRTKWSKLCEEFSKTHEQYINVRYKTIYSDKIGSFSPVWWNELFEESPAIEWLDFDPVKKEHRGRLVSDKKTDISAIILQILEEQNIPYSIEKSYFRVWGYISENQRPIFE
ncbi:MAG: DUF6678 family protein [Arenicella sp.]